MNAKFWIEAFGYLGSILVVVSMLMTSVKRLRIINTTGSVIFAIYALIIRSYPTAFMNFCLVAINVYQLYQLGKRDRHFHLIEGDAKTGMLHYLLDYYREDITHFFPDFDSGETSKKAYLISCDALPAGILLGNLDEDGTLNVAIDYSTPAYRDCSVGKFLYEHLPEQGVRQVVFSGKSVDHEDYLKKMGFVRDGEIYRKELTDALSHSR